MRRRWLLAPFLCGLLWLTACDWEDFGSSDRFTEDFHQTHALKAGGRITLETFNGSVEISGWDQDTVDISGTKYAATAELRDALKIEITPSADSIYIRTVRPSTRGNMGARYVIKAPRRVDLERIVSSNGAIRVNDILGMMRLKTSNGALRAVNLKGSLDAVTSNGSAELQNVEGTTSIKTSNGRVRAEAIRGGLEVETSNGGISAQVSKIEAGKSVRLYTSNGGVDLTMDVFNQNEIHAQSSNGGITVHLPSNINAQVRARTSNSSITSEFDVRMQGQISKHNLEGTIGNGGPVLDLSTSNGSIRLLKM
jgi:Putative adhesin